MSAIETGVAHDGSPRLGASEIPVAQRSRAAASAISAGSRP